MRHGPSGGEGSVVKAIEFGEEWRSQDSAGIPQIHLVEHIARRSTQRKVVTAIGAASPHHGATACAEQRTTRTAAPARATAPTSTALDHSWTTLVSRALDLGAESEGLTQAQIEGDVRGPGPVVNGRGSFTRSWQRVESPERRAIDGRSGSWRHHRRTSCRRDQSRPVVEN